MLREIAPWNSVFLWKMKRTVARSWNSHWEQKRTRTKSQLRQRRLWLSSWRELWMLYRYWTLGGYAVTHLSSYLPGAGHRFESRWSPKFFLQLRWSHLNFDCIPAVQINLISEKLALVIAQNFKANTQNPDLTIFNFWSIWRGSLEVNQQTRKGKI